MSRQGVAMTKNRMRGSKVSLAAVFASQLKADPVMASHVRDIIAPKALAKLLAISPLDLIDTRDPELNEADRMAL